MGWFSENIETMDDLFQHTLEDIYYAEHQITKALPDMIEKATDPNFARASERICEQTEGQIERLNRVFQKLEGLDPRAPLPGDRRHHQGSQ